MLHTFFYTNHVQGAGYMFKQMSYRSYQILHSECIGEKYVVSLLALTSQKKVQAEIQFELDTWLLKLCGEKEYHIIIGYCDPNCVLDDSFSGDEAIFVGDKDVRYNMSEICKPMNNKFDIKEMMYLCVSL